MAYVDAGHALLVAKESDADIRTDAVNAGAQTIDSCLGRQYVVPVDTTGNDALTSWLEEINLWLALYSLSAGGAGTGRKVAKDYSEAMRRLNSIKNGSAILPGGVNAASGGVAGTIEAIGGAPTIFTRALFNCEDGAI